MDEGLLIVISGPSGCGKGTICKKLLERNDSLNLSISTTTRKPRKGETDRENYFFIGEDDFKKMIENDQLLEYANVYGNYYGTPKEFVLEKLKNGKDVLLEIDIQGALKVREVYKKGIFIFILPPSMEELKSRIVNRGTETKKDIEKRFKSAYNELKFVKEYDYAVINDDVSNAVEVIEFIIVAEKHRVSRQKNILEQICK